LISVFLNTGVFLVIKNKNSWAQIIETIDKPLGFFVLALLIVESFLCIVLVKSDLSAVDKFYGMLLGVFLFILVVIGVWILVWFKPKHLVYNQNGILADQEKSYGSETSPVANKEAIDYLVNLRREKR
jgi:branched-subunit amino acid transport protein AzlD